MVSKDEKRFRRIWNLGFASGYKNAYEYPSKKTYGTSKGILTKLDKRVEKIIKSVKRCKR